MVEMIYYTLFDSVTYTRVYGMIDIFSTKKIVNNDQEMSFIGKKYIDDRENQDGVVDDDKDGNVVKDSELPQGARVIRKDTMVTMDYRPERLNLYLDDDDKVVKIINE